MSMEIDSIDDMDLSRKRPSGDEPNGESQPKRQRTGEPESHPGTPVGSVLIERPVYDVVRHPSAEAFGRDGLRRAIGIALKHVGFDSATYEALEGFTDAADTCMRNWIFI